MLFIAFVILAGAALPIQAAVNVRLRQLTSSNYSAAMISFLVGTLTLVLLTLSSEPIKYQDQSTVTVRKVMAIKPSLTAIYDTFLNEYSPTT